MKRNELKEIKALEPKEIFLRARKIKEEIANLRLDKFNSTKSKQGADNIKVIFGRRKDIAQFLTIARQKEILSELSDKSKETKNSEKDIVMDNSADKSKSKKKGRTELSK